MMNAEQLLEGLARLLAPAIAKAVVAELRAGTNDMIDQSASPLGTRRHCGAVRRLVAAGSEGAAIVGRRHLLTRARVDQELELVTAKKKKTRKADTAATPRDADLDELYERFDLVRTS